MPVTVTGKVFLPNGDIGRLQLSNKKEYYAQKMSKEGCVKLVGSSDIDTFYLMRGTIADDNVIGATAYTYLPDDKNERIGLMILERIRAQTGRNVLADVDPKVLGEAAIYAASGNRDSEKDAVEKAASKKS